MLFALALVLAVAITFMGMAGQASAGWPEGTGMQTLEMGAPSAKSGFTQRSEHLPKAQLNQTACGIGMSYFILDARQDASHAAALLDAMFVRSGARWFSSRDIIPPTPPPDFSLAA